jgi:hypothetical protein
VSALTTVLSAVVALVVSQTLVLSQHLVESVVVCSVVADPPQDVKAATIASAKIVFFIFLFF